MDMRRIALILATVFLFSVFWACQTGGGTDAEKAAECKDGEYRLYDDLHVYSGNYTCVSSCPDGYIGLLDEHDRKTCVKLCDDGSIPRPNGMGGWECDEDELSDPTDIATDIPTATPTATPTSNRHRLSHTNRYSHCPSQQPLPRLKVIA